MSAEVAATAGSSSIENSTVPTENHNSTVASKVEEEEKMESEPVNEKKVTDSTELTSSTKDKEPSSEDAKDHTDETCSESSAEAMDTTDGKEGSPSTDDKNETGDDDVESDNKKESPEKESQQKEKESSENKDETDVVSKKSPKKESPKKETESTDKVKRSPKKEPSHKKESPKKVEKKVAEPVDQKPSDDMPLLEAPLVVEGKRRRQSTQRLEATATPHQTVKTVEIPTGSGTKFGEIEYIESLISKTNSDDLKVLHRICFGVTGKATMIKRNLRQFCGFAFDTLDDEYIKKKKIVDKYHLKDIKKVCEVLGLERSGKHSDLVEHVMQFLLKPVDSGRKAPAKKGKKRKSSTTKRKSSKGKGKSSKADESDKSEGSDNDEESGEEKSGSSDDEEVEETNEPPSKKSKSSPKTVPKKKAGRPAKKNKKPSDTELTTAIKGLLKGINLEEVTMKEMCKMVYDKFPDVDLAERKDFIKSTVKSIISAGD